MPSDALLRAIRPPGLPDASNISGDDISVPGVASTSSSRCSNRASSRLGLRTKEYTVDEVQEEGILLVSALEAPFGTFHAVLEGACMLRSCGCMAGGLQGVGSCGLQVLPPLPPIETPLGVLSIWNSRGSKGVGGLTLRGGYPVLYCPSPAPLLPAPALAPPLPRGADFQITVCQLVVKSESGAVLVQCVQF